MQQGLTNGFGSGLVDADSVFDALAILLQAGFLYPPKDPRVDQACAALGQRMQQLSPGGAPIEVRFTPDGVALAGARIDPAKPGVAWVRDRFARARLAAVCITPEAPPHALIEFVLALRRCFAPNAPPFAEIWKGGGQGVEPVPAEATRPPTRAPRAGAAPQQAARPPSATGHDAILVALSRSKKARAILGEIHRRVEEEYDGEVHVDIAGMLEEVVGQLPDELRRDPRQGLAQVGAVLDLLRRQLEGFLLAHPDDPSGRLTEVAKTLLKRRLSGAGNAPARRRAPPEKPAPPAAAPPPPEPAPAAQQPAKPPGSESFEGFVSGLRQDLATPATGSGTPRLNRLGQATSDAQIEDDLPALLEELRALPKADVFDAELDGLIATDELLGTCMHLLAHGRDGSVVGEGTTRLIDHLMATPTPRQRRILGAYLRLARDGDIIEKDPVAQERLVEFLQGNGVEHMMSARETLDVEQVARTFPTQLAMFLDALELKDPTSESAFVELWERVGEEAMVQATGALIEDGTLLTPNRTEKILRFGGARAAPIAQQLVRAGANWTRAQVVNFLRRQGLPRQETAALSIVQPVTSLPAAYLADLCEVIANDGTTNAKLHGYTSLLLRQYIRDTVEKPGDLDRRLYAIRALGHWPTPETVQHLEQLSKEGRLLQQSKEARAIRQAASEALAQIHSHQMSAR